MSYYRKELLFVMVQEMAKDQLSRGRALQPTGFVVLLFGF